MVTFSAVPGFPAGGHITRGTWHPGRGDDCPKCLATIPGLRHALGGRTREQAIVLHRAGLERWHNVLVRLADRERNDPDARNDDRHDSQVRQAQVLHDAHLRDLQVLEATEP